jgi:hypothetical protein
MTAPTQFHTSWRKSSYSGNDSNCVEIAYGDAMVGVRDSKNPEAGQLELSGDAFRSFVIYLKAN